MTKLMPAQEKLDESALGSSSVHLAVIDGYGFVFRAYHALPGLVSPDGLPVGAVFGFMSMIFKIMEDLKPSHTVVVFDSGEKNFRHEIYSDYKSHRPKVPEELKLQFSLIRDAINSLNISSIEKQGYEADDLIASITKRAKSNFDKITIVSSDKDLMQLINDKVKMYDPLKSKVIDFNEVHEKFGVGPKSVRCVLALTGDSSDNIPGVPGFGPKTAAELINQFGSFEELLARSSEIKQERRRRLIEDNLEIAKISYQLVRLEDNNGLEIELDNFKFKPAKRDILISFLEKYGFKRLYSRAEKYLLGSENSLFENIKNKSPYLVKSIDYVLLRAQQDGRLFIYFNGTSLFIANYYRDVCQIKKDEYHKLNAILDDDSVLKISHNVKKLMWELDREIYSYHDVMILSYLLNNGLIKHDLESLNAEHFGLETKDDLQIVTLIGKIYEIQKQQIFDNQLTYLYEYFERPLSKVLYRMEKKGVKIDTIKLKELSSEFNDKISLLEQKIYKQVGYEFNLSSPKQLSNALFETMGIGGVGRTSKTKNLSTDAATLEHLSDIGHQIADDILAYRHYYKLKTTYSDALPEQVDKNTGRVHTNFGMANTTTGRLSSNNPNLQNIPIRHIEGQKIRSCFVAEKGFKIISADYSQIELRLLAHIADIAELKHAFYNNQDIHASTASSIFNVNLDEVNKDMRRKAKAINFGIIYGITSFGLSKQLDISREEAEAYIKAYFKKYPGIEKYMEDIKESAKNKGYVETIYKRRCYIKAISDKNNSIRSFAQRAAINAPIQGSAADIIKKAMIEIDEEISSKNYKTKMILQVHDELLFEAPDEECFEILVLIKKLMENTVNISVPLVVDLNHGECWSK